MPAFFTDPHPAYYTDLILRLIGYGVLLLGGGGGALFLRALLERKKIAAEAGEAEARALETTARAELTLVKANVSASEMVRAATETIRSLQTSTLELTYELDDARRDFARVTTEKDLLHNENELLNLQVVRAKNILNRHNLKDELSDMSLIKPRQLGDGTDPV